MSINLLKKSLYFSGMHILLRWIAKCLCVYFSGLVSVFCPHYKKNSILKQLLEGNDNLEPFFFLVFMNLACRYLTWAKRKFCCDYKRKCQSET